jgi:hypothetical protein
MVPTLCETRGVVKTVSGIFHEIDNYVDIKIRIQLIHKQKVMVIRETEWRLACERRADEAKQRSGAEEDDRRG